MARLKELTALPGGTGASGASYSANGYRVEMVRSCAELAPYAGAWDGLAASAPSRVHSVSHAWVASFFEHLAPPGADCRCLLVFEGGDLVGVLPFTVRRKYLSVITKSDVCPPTSDQTFASDLVCRCDDSASIIGAMTDALDHFLPGAWELTFHHVSCRSQIVECLSRGAPRVLHHIKLDGYGNLIRTDGPFSTYAGSLRPKFATNLRRLIRKIEKLPGFEVRFLEGDEAGPGRVEDFLRLEASGWKGRGGTAILNSEKECAFYRSFAKRLHERRWLEWHVLSVGGHDVASQLAIKAGRVLYIWKIAYDENYSAYAPGNILMLRTIERAFESSDVDEINCLTNSHWNRDWNMERREYLRVTIWPKRALPFVAGYCRVKSKDVLRRIPGARTLHRGYLRATAPLARASRATGSSSWRRAERRPPGLR